MAGLSICREDASTTVTLRLEGTLDGATASAVLEALLAESVGQEVVLDFSRVGDFRDLAVAVLSRGLERRKVRLRGLDVHHERMFRYFGLTSTATPERAYYTPEELMA
jgi:anti-anti-sigma regulatory factor